MSFPTFVCTHVDSFSINKIALYTSPCPLCLWPVMPNHPPKKWHLSYSTELSPSPLTRILNCFLIFADPIRESWYLMVVLINISFLIIVWSWTSLVKSVVQHLQSCMGIPSSLSSLGSKLSSRVEPSVFQGTFFKMWQNQQHISLFYFSSVLPVYKVKGWERPHL